MYKWKYLVNGLTLLLLFNFIFQGCSNVLDFDDKPEVKERQNSFKLRFIDNTGFMNKLYGNDYVRNADIYLKSNSLGLEYHLQADSNGVVDISNIVTDKYLISVKRNMTPEELETIFGTYTKDYTLVNKDIKSVDLNPVNGIDYSFKLDTVVSSALVISEIYASGPPGSGLYYHDKYIEIYNQSEYVQYLDSLIIAVVYASSYLGLNFRDDPEFIHSKSIWMFPGTGKDFPIMPGHFVLCAADAIDHRVNASGSVDLSNASFEFYKDDAPDVDNPIIPNMIRIYQPSGNDWLIGGEKGALIIARMNAADLLPYDDQFLIPYKNILDGAEYMDDVSKLDEKILNPGIDAGATGGIQFYTGKSMERKQMLGSSKFMLSDENNSSLDFLIISPPSPGYHSK